MSKTDVRNQRNERSEILPTLMKFAVYLYIESLKEKGGPDAEDLKKAQETSDILGEHGDILLNGGGKKGEQADQFNRTAHAFAVLAFCPGGVEVFGARFEARKQSEKSKQRRKQS